MRDRPLVLVTGASRMNGIGAAIALELAKSNWNIAITYWTDYDNSMPWGSRAGDVDELRRQCEQHGASVVSIESDLSDTKAPESLFDTIEGKTGSVLALILSHAYSVDRSILTATVEEFDMHFDVNVRASWLLIREFARRFQFNDRPGRIIALTSDHTSFNLPYGASKGALDRIVIAAAEELREKRILANAINPGPNDTGWMDDSFKEVVAQKTYQGRVGNPQDTANLVSFLCSKKGEWINGQLLHSNGGVRW